MKTEAGRAVVRIISNYVRLATTLGLGLVFLPFAFFWLGNDCVALINFLGASVGVAAMFREITTRAVVQDLAHADHSENRANFRRVMSSAMRVSAFMSFVAGAIFVGIYFLLSTPLVRIPDELMPAARAMTISQAIYIMLYTWLTPIFNMLLVRERFIEQNFWAIVERAAMLGSALFLYYVAGMREDAPRALTAWAWLMSAVNILTFLIPVARMLISDPDLRPRRELVDRTTTRELAANTWRYVAVETASALYEKAGVFMMNYYFALAGNLVFGVALQFCAYVRMATQGVTFGVESVSARLSTRKKDSMSILVHHSTRLHGLVALPACLCVMALTDPLFRVWIGGKMENPEENIPKIVVIARILVIALTARSISDNWMMIMYGAGHLKRYARLVLAGGVLNVVLSILILMVMHSAPESQRLLVVPWVFTAVYTLFHFVLLPRVASQCLEIPLADLFTPLTRPVIVTAICSPVVIFAPKILEIMGWRWNVWTLGGTIAVFGILFGLLSSVIVLSGAERGRFIYNPVRRLLGVKPAAKRA